MANLLSLPHSRLYPITPIGLETARVESLTSYITRLAEAHSVFTGTLITHELAPCIKKAYVSGGESRDVSAFMRYAASMNGVGTLAEDWVRVLEQLTLRVDLRALTMLFWSQVLSSRGLIRPLRVWCPECYGEWSEKGQVIYEPLLWTLRAVSICPWHKRPLCDQCPYADCQKSLPWLAWHSRPGYCSRCERWLGLASSEKRFAFNHQTKEESLWQTWVMESLGEMLAAPSPHFSPPARQKIVTALAMCIEQFGERNAAALARSVGLPKTTMWEWQHGLFLPPLEILLRLCSKINVSLPALILPEVVKKKVNAERVLQWDISPEPGGPRRSWDPEQVQQELEHILKEEVDVPPSLRQVALHLNIHHRTLATYFPELCRAITARYRAYTHKRGEQRIGRLREEIRQIATRLHVEGVDPTHRQVAALLKRPGRLRERVARTSLQDIRKELSCED